MVLKKPPPIQWLPIFEAAARLCSFKKAAQELCVTPPAVSQQIKVLEDYLGIALFDRKGRKLKLTQAGEFYYQQVHEIIKSHGRAHRELSRKFQYPVLQVSAPIFIAQELLIPNYLTFKSVASNLELRIVTGNEYVDFETEQVDAAVRFGDGNWPELECREICPVKLRLVCSPGYYSELVGAQSDLANSRQLAQHTLISLSEDLQDWKDLFPDLEPERAIICDSYFSAVRSAEEGLGIGIGLSPAINRLIRTGRLYELPLACIEAGLSYWLVAPKNNTCSKYIGLFYQWVKGLFDTLE